MDGGEKGLAVETHETDSEGGAGEHDFGAAGEMELLRVGTEVELRRVGTGIDGTGVGDEAQVRAVGHDDGAQGEIVGGDGCDDEAAAVGREDGAAAAEGVGGGAGGGSDDKAVGGVGGNEVARDIEVGAQQGGIVEAMEAYLVEREESTGSRIGRYLQEGAGLEGVAAAKDVVDESVDVVASGGGEEAEMAKVDA